MVEDTPLSELAQKYERVLGQTAELNKPGFPSRELPALFPDHPPDQAWCNRHIFSDSIILVSTSDDEIGCAKLLVYSWRLTQAFLAFGMPVRGAVTCGDIYENPLRNVVLGLPMTRAYELERDQQWIGVVIDPSVESAFPALFNSVSPAWQFLSNILLCYPVSLKSGQAEFWTLNWRFNLTVEKGTKSLFSTSGERHIQEKVHNTLQYARAVVNAGKAYPPSHIEMPIELGRFGVGSKAPPSRMVMICRRLGVVPFMFDYPPDRQKRHAFHDGPLYFVACSAHQFSLAIMSKMTYALSLWAQTPKRVIDTCRQRLQQYDSL